jgi:hypothetical protein
MFKQKVKLKLITSNQKNTMVLQTHHLVFAFLKFEPFQTHSLLIFLSASFLLFFRLHFATNLMRLIEHSDSKRRKQADFFHENSEQNSWKIQKMHQQQSSATRDHGKNIERKSQIS